MEYQRKEPEVILPQIYEPDMSFEDEKPQALCAHFVRGTCKFGATCRNLHMDRDAAMNSNDYGKSYQRIVDASNKPGDGKKQLCRFFSKTGNCRFAKDCHFLHQKDEGNPGRYSRDGHNRGNVKHSQDNTRRKN